MENNKSYRVILLILSMAVFSIASADQELPAKDKLLSCDTQLALSAAYEILNNPLILGEPLEMFAPVMALYQNGKKNDAVFWYYVAQLRAQNQLAYQNGDRGQLIAVMSMTTGSLINNYAFQDTSKLNATLDTVLAWDKKTQNPYLKKPILLKDKVGIGYKFIETLKGKISSPHKETEDLARKNSAMYDQLLEDRRKQMCKPGQPDPALIPQIVKNEKLQVVEFVKTNEKVLSEASTVENASLSLSTTNGDSSLPFRYEIDVGGIHAIVNVTRENGNAKFFLACTTKMSLGSRNPNKDVCSQ